MKKLLFIVCVGLISFLPISGQSGTGSLKGFVAKDIRNDSAIDAIVELRAIRNYPGTNEVETTGTTGGYYELQVSFGYYWLTISSKGYKTYRTKVYIPSSSILQWATILEKELKIGKTKKEKDEIKGSLKYEN